MQDYAAAMPDTDIMKIVRRRIAERIEAIRRSGRKISGTRASLTAGLSRGAVGDILRRINKNPTVPVLSAIAGALECDLAYILGQSDHPRSGASVGPIDDGIIVAGTVEAGVFREMTSQEPWLDEANLERINAPRSVRFPSKHHFAWKVRGDSMNAAKPKSILEGEYVLCVDFVDAELSIADGSIYVVRRTSHGGQTIEWTIKRARIYRDRVELVPQSSNISHKTIVIPQGEDKDENGDEISVVGWCYGTYAPLD